MGFGDLGESQIDLEVVLRGGVVNGEATEAYVVELAPAAGGGMTIDKCDVHATVVVCGAGVAVGFSVTCVKRPKALVGIGKIN